MKLRLRYPLFPGGTFCSCCLRRSLAERMHGPDRRPKESARYLCNCLSADVILNCVKSHVRPLPTRGLAMHKVIGSCVSVVKRNRLSAEEVATYPIHNVPQTMRQAKGGSFDIIWSGNVHLQRSRMTTSPIIKNSDYHKSGVLPGSIIAGGASGCWCRAVNDDRLR